MKYILNLIIFSLIFSASVNAQSYGGRYDDMPFNRYFARIKKNNVNIRARQTTSSEIMYKLSKGTDVLVIGEAGEWLKIKPEAGNNAWIHKDMVEEGLVIKNNVNVRTGPSLSNSILGKLSEGDPIMEIRREGDWIEMEMPRNFGFWIARFLVKFLCPADSYQEFLVNEEMSKKRFSEAEEIRRLEFTKRFQDVDHDKIIELYQNIISEFPDTPVAIKAQERIVDAREKKSMAAQKKITVKEMRRILKLYDDADRLFRELELDTAASEERFREANDKFQYIVDNYPNTREARMSREKIDNLLEMKKLRLKEWQQVSSFEGEGKIRKAKPGRTYEKATHVLYSNGFLKEELCALICNTVDLRAFEKKKVLIKGRIIKDSEDYFDYPLIEVETIKLN